MSKAHALKSVKRSDAFSWSAVFTSVDTCYNCASWFLKCNLVNRSCLILFKVHEFQDRNTDDCIGLVCFLNMFFLCTRRVGLDLANMFNQFTFAWYALLIFMFNKLRLEVIDRFIDIDGIVDHHCLNFLFIFIALYVHDRRFMCCFAFCFDLCVTI